MRRILDEAGSQFASRRWRPELFFVASVLAISAAIVAGAAEIPNALTDLLRHTRGKTPDQVYETLLDEHCLSPVGVEQRAQVIALIGEADAKAQRAYEQRIVGATREYEIAVALMGGGYLNARAYELFNTITYKPSPQVTVPQHAHPSTRAPTPSAENTEPPVAEYREVHSGPAGETGSLLTIDRTGQATVQTLPLGPRSKTMRTHLSCAELVDLPQAMKEEFTEFQPSYGQEGPAYQGEISIVDRWEGRERHVVWRNPPSRPKPPEGSWARVAVYFEDIRRRAEEASKLPAEKNRENAIVYGQSSSGVVGTYHHSLAIDKSGHAVFRGGLGWAAYRTRGETQLTAEELGTLVRAIQQANFSSFQECYGRHAVVNEQSVSLGYEWDGKQADVLWMSPPAEPKPPDAWFRIVGILDQVWARAEKGAAIREALDLIAEGKLDPSPLSVTYDDMHGLWGGLALTIHGDGRVKQRAVKTEARTPTRVSRDGILKLVRLLLSEKAWEQREPARASKPDESKARLVVEYGNERSEIWEWYNDLDKNQRLGKVRDLMKAVTSEGASK